MFDFPDVSGQNDFALIEDCDVVAEFFHIVHLVAGKQDELPVADQLPDHVFQNDGVDRVETGKRFVQNDEVRVGDQGGGKLNFLLVAFAERIQLFS